jgi:hypothetical protein
MSRLSLPVAMIATLVVCTPVTAAPPSLTTGVVDPSAFIGSTAQLAFARVRASGAATVRITIPWRNVAPAGVTRPLQFDATDHTDKRYRWNSIDKQVAEAARNALDPILCIQLSPAWAERYRDGQPGTGRPDPAELRQFALAAATRYSGRYSDLPRVRYWQVWNEPNLIFYLTPQYVEGKAVSPAWYRSMVNAFADGVHTVYRDNIVVAGGLAPFTTHTGESSAWGLGPLAFMREMLCVSKKLRPTCRAQTRFDVWAHHPYTSGGPTHHAELPDDVSIPDLPRMSRLLNAAIHHRRVVSEHTVQFWVTEFSWDSSPPDPKGVPANLHARWVAEALYRMWSAGVSLVAWFKLRDDPFTPESYIQSGLYFRASTLERDRPKPALRAFRFPFVALPERGTTVTWGRTPTSKPGRVLLHVQASGRWLPLAVLRANRYGIFGRRLTVARGRLVRATYLPTGDRSLPFQVVKTRDRPMYAFGTLPG